MRTGYRVFLVDQSDRLHKISHARFDALLGKEPQESVPAAFIGEDRVRYAMAAYETHERKPVDMLRIDCGILPLDADGMLDESRKLEWMRLVGTAWSPLDDVLAVPRKSGTVIDGTGVFAEKRLRHEWQWQPSAEVERQIYQAVFGRV